MASVRLPQGLRSRLALLVTLALVPALLVTAYGSLVERDQALERVEAQAALLAATIAKEQVDAIEFTGQLLLGLSELEDVHPDRPEACTDVLVSFHRAFPQSTGFGVASLDGVVVCLSIPFDPPLHVGDRPYFQRALSTGGFAVGDYQKGSVTGEPILIGAVPLRDGDDVVGVLFGSMRLTWLTQVMGLIEVPEGSVVNLIDLNGVLLTRRPDPEAYRGRDVSGVEIYRVVASEKEGVRRAESVDGEDRLFAFTTIRVFEDQEVAYVTVGIQESVVVAPIHQAFALRLTIIAFLGVALLVATLLVSEATLLRAVRQLQDAARRLARGDLGARAPDRGPVELRELAVGFNEMADALQRQVGQLEGSQAELQRAKVELELRVKRRTMDLERANAAMEDHAARLMRSNRELEEFAYVASHDMQEPLRKIEAFGDRLRAKHGDRLGPEAQDYLARMESAARRMRAMVNDLLALSRVTTQEKPHEPVPLKEVVEEAVDDLEDRIVRTGGRVEVGDLPTVEGDPSQLHHLFLNLIGNALKFHRPGVPPQVKVTGRSVEASGGAGPHHVVEVRDNGIGFDGRYEERIFRPFQRLHGRNEYEGTGIGLAICRKIVERHGGQIHGEGRPGEGSTFRFTFPARPKEATA